MDALHQPAISSAYSVSSSTRFPSGPPGHVAGDAGTGRQPGTIRRPDAIRPVWKGDKVLMNEPPDRWGFWCLVVALIQLQLDLITKL